MNNYFAKRIILLITIFFSINIFAQELYSFDSPLLQKRFLHITEELRCLVCQNESLAESNAPLAKDLRHEVYLKMQNGDSDDEIKHYLVNRYGQFILFKPAFNSLTYVLWGLPIFTLMAGCSIIFLLSTRKKKLITIASTKNVTIQSIPPSTKQTSNLLLIALILFILISSLGLYFKIGASGLVMDHFASERHTKEVQAEIERLGSLENIINKMQERVYERQDKEGWLLLGRLYMKAGRTEEAQKAFEEAGKLSSD